MSVWDTVALEVKKQYPPFNDFLLKEFRTREVNNSVKHMDMVISEAIKLFGGQITYRGCRILDPMEQIENLWQSFIHYGCNIQNSELNLVEFEFEYQNRIITSVMYLPYMVDGAIVIDDINYYIQVALVERVFSRIKDGLIIKVMRQPMFFHRVEQLAYTTTKGETFWDAVITTRIHWRETNKSRKFKTPLLLYPLSHRGLTQTLIDFGIDPKQLVFVNHPDRELPDDWHEFKLKSDLYLHVHKKVCEDMTNRRVIASLIYCLKQTFISSTLDRIYAPDGVIWKILLGKSIFGVKKTKDLQAYQYADSHLESLETYLDPRTQRELDLMGIHCKDIHELLITTFKNLNTWLIQHQPNNLYEKKVGVLELILANLVHAIFNKFYGKRQPSAELVGKSVGGLLKFPTRKISTIYDCGAALTAAIYNDNLLLSAWGKRVRQPISTTTGSKKNRPGRKKTYNPINSADNQFHPSFLACLSILDISSSSPGESGAINPYCQIDEHGTFIRPDWADDLDELVPFLPRR